MRVLEGYVGLCGSLDYTSPGFPGSFVGPDRP